MKKVNRIWDIALWLGAFMLYMGVANAQWAQGKGHAYLKLGSWNQSSNTRFLSNGLLNYSPEDADRIGQANTSYSINGLFARVGIDSLHTITVNIPVVTARLGTGSSVGESFSSTNLGDTNITIERHLWNNSGFVGGVALTLGIPTGNTNPTGGSFLASGDGEFNQMIRLLLGASYKIREQNFYWKGIVGFNNRTKGFNNEYRLNLETGTTVGKLFGLIRLNSTQFFNDDEGDEFVGNFLATNFERTNVGSEITYYFAPKFGISVGYTHILSGRNIINAPAITAGFIHKF